MTTAIEVLQNCKVEGMVVKLPDTKLDRKVYQDTAKKLELIGGKWKGGKVFGFVFNEDPTELLEQIANGDSRNLKKEFQFFATPDTLADELVALANPSSTDWILEPSAGQGAIVKAISRYCDTQDVHCYELMPLNATFLSKIPNARILGDDFLKHDPSTDKFDVIIANPPFSKNQDIDHIKKMYECLNPYGRIVSIASKHWQLSSNKKEVEFKNWLAEIGADVQDVPARAFKESGTNIAACIIVIQKAA